MAIGQLVMANSEKHVFGDLNQCVTQGILINLSMNTIFKSLCIQRGHMI